MYRHLIRGAGGAAIVAALAAGAFMTSPAQSVPPEDLQAAKSASARYHSVEQALADGYVRTPECVRSPAGAMGIHFENPELMEDPGLDLRHPEVLLYMPKENGELELVGIEFYREADQAPARPELFGRGFNGPMPAHHPGMETHYDLHVWLWADNPSGTFAQFNPALACG